jgi:predicted AlkP superfamily phosphohydrolase/phosphomutase
VGVIQERIVLTRFWQDKYFGDIAKQLLTQKGKFDLFAIYFRGTDTMAHQFIGFSETAGLVDADCGVVKGCDNDRLRSALGNYYSFVDSQIGEILKLQDKNTITMIVTDHGEAAVGNKGSHQNNGFILLSGPGIRKTNLTASVLDIAPTVLYLLDLPIAQDMDGVVLKNAFEKRLLVEKPLRFLDSYDPIVPAHPAKIEIDEELDEQDTQELKALGYIN